MLLSVNREGFLLTFLVVKSLKIAVCDDEEKSAENVVRHLDYYSVNNDVKFEKYIFTSPNELLKSKINFDIAILDVEMEEKNGIKLGEELRKRLPHIVLMYITAHKKYLDDALNLNAVRFFEKPIDSQRFYRGLTDALKRIDNTTVSFYLKNDKSIVRINAHDVVFVEIEKRKTKIVTVDDKIYQSEKHIGFWQDKLKGPMYVSPHKSFIINLSYVTEYEREYVILNKKYKINIARSKQKEFYRKFMQFLEVR